MGVTLVTKRLPLKNVKWIVVHYSATPIERNVSAADIEAMHKAKGYKAIGYHFYIRRSGEVEVGRPIADGYFTQGAHVLGHNPESIGICFEGGVTLADMNTGRDTRTPGQTKALISIIEKLLVQCPGAQVVGHKDMPGAKTQCPGFDVAAWWARVKTAREAKPAIVSEASPASAGLLTQVLTSLLQLLLARKAK